MDNQNKITAVFEFTETGDLKAIYFNARCEVDYKTLNAAVARLLSREAETIRSGSDKLKVEMA
jgi:hypothetical protein